MKTLYTLLFLLSTISISSLVDAAYTYTFRNTTDFDVLIGIEFSGDTNADGVPYYKKLIEKGTTGTFSPGTDFPGGKIGFCLSNVFFIKNPSQEQINTPTSWSWKKEKSYLRASVELGVSRYLNKVNSFIRYLNTNINTFKVPLRENTLAPAEEWPSNCGSVDVYIIQDKAQNIYFLSVYGRYRQKSDFAIMANGIDDRNKSIYPGAVARSWTLQQINDALGIK